MDFYIQPWYKNTLRRELNIFGYKKELIDLAIEKCNSVKSAMEYIKNAEKVQLELLKAMESKIDESILSNAIDQIFSRKQEKPISKFDSHFFISG